MWKRGQLRRVIQRKHLFLVLVLVIIFLGVGPQISWRREFTSLSREIRNIWYGYSSSCYIRNGPHLFMISNEEVKIIWETSCEKPNKLFIREGGKDYREISVLQEELEKSHFTYQTNIPINENFGYEIIVCSKPIMRAFKNFRLQILSRKEKESTFLSLILRTKTSNQLCLVSCLIPR